MSDAMSHAADAQRAAEERAKAKYDAMSDKELDAESANLMPRLEMAQIELEKAESKKRKLIAVYDDLVTEYVRRANESLSKK